MFACLVLLDGAGATLVTYELVNLELELESLVRLVVPSEHK